MHSTRDSDLKRRRARKLSSKESMAHNGGKYNVSAKEQRMYYGIVFDSQAEANEYLYARAELESGRIRELILQKAFVLQEAFIDAKGKHHQDIEYVADFYFYDVKQKRYRVVDTKGFKTDMFRIKEKLFNFKYKEKGLYIEAKI